MPRGKQHVNMGMHNGEDFSCFSSLNDWYTDLRKRHPKASVRVSPENIHRAYIGKTKIAAFNAPFGHGYVAGQQIADYLSDHPHRNSKRHVSLAMFRGALLRSPRKGVGNGA